MCMMCVNLFIHIIYSVHVTSLSHRGMRLSFWKSRLASIGLSFLKRTDPRPRVYRPCNVVPSWKWHSNVVSFRLFESGLKRSSILESCTCLDVTSREESYELTIPQKTETLQAVLNQKPVCLFFTSFYVFCSRRTARSFIYKGNALSTPRVQMQRHSSLMGMSTESSDISCSSRGPASAWLQNCIFISWLSWCILKHQPHLKIQAALEKLTQIQKEFQTAALASSFKGASRPDILWYVLDLS